MVLGWVSVAFGVFFLGVVAYALVRRWTPRRWGGLYKQFAVGVGGASVGLTAQGVAELTEGTASRAAQLVAVAGFLAAVVGLLAFRYAERRRSDR